MLLLLVNLSALAQSGSFELTPQQEAKAKKNADLEIKNLPPKGWTVNRSDLSFVEMMQQAWRFKFAMEDAKTPKFIYTFGNGRGKTKEAAYGKACSKAQEQLPNLILMYFSMWNGVASITDDEKSKISEAIDQSGKKITNRLESLLTHPFVNMLRTKGSQTEVHVRYYYNQMECRRIARELIMEELAKTTDWSREKMTSLLTYKQ